MHITPMLFLHWLLATIVMAVCIFYVGGEVIGWENIRFYGGRGSLYKMASNTLVVIVAGWVLISFCLYAAAQDGELPLEGVVFASIGWFLMLLAPVGIYVSRL